MYVQCEHNQDGPLGIRLCDEPISLIPSGYSQPHPAMTVTMTMTMTHHHRQESAFAFSCHFPTPQGSTRDHRHCPASRGQRQFPHNRDKHVTRSFPSRNHSTSSGPVITASGAVFWHQVGDRFEFGLCGVLPSGDHRRGARLCPASRGREDWTGTGSWW